MERQDARNMLRQLPSALLATSAVVMPRLLIWLLRAGGIRLPVLWLMPLSAGLAVGSCHVGVRLWERRPRSDERLFADLMLWGWLRRWRLERQIASTVSALGLEHPGGARTAVGGLADHLQLLQQLVGQREARDPYMNGHSRRVARYSSLMAPRLGLHGEEIERVRLAAALHDLGKSKTPTAILHKPGQLTDEEYAIVKQHAATGSQMILSLAEDPDLAAMVRHHHERLDGTGYPDGLAGESIPLAARIIAVADTFDAITADRPYRPARPHKKALDILRKEAGAQLDGDVVAAFESVYAHKWPVGVVAAALSTGARGLSGLLSGAPAAATQVTGVAAAGALAGLASAALVKVPGPTPAQATRSPRGTASTPLRAGSQTARQRDAGTHTQTPVRTRPDRAASVPLRLASATGARDTGRRGSKRAVPTPTGAQSTPTPTAASTAGSTSTAPTPTAPTPSRPTVSASAGSNGSGAAASAKAGVPGATVTIGGTLNQHGASAKVGISGGPLTPPLSTTVSVPLPPLPPAALPHLPKLPGK